MAALFKTGTRGSRGGLETRPWRHGACPCMAGRDPGTLLLEEIFERAPSLVRVP